MLAGVVTGVDDLVLNFGLTLLEVEPVSDLSLWPESFGIFSASNQLFQHGFRGVKPSKMVKFRSLKTQMTKFYFLHVQTILKITSSAVQTRFSRLEQSQSWNFMKCALTKITAYWG